jgi:uncharacterized protein (TIGR03067 family)
MKRAAWVVVLTGLLLGARSQSDDAVKKELEKFQGAWIATALESNGQKAPEDQIKLYRITFTGDKYVEKVAEQTVEEGTQKLDPTKKPKTMDITITQGGQKGEMQLAIYEIEGDMLKICAAQAGSKDRPADFTAKAGSDRLLIILKKDKAK